MTSSYNASALTPTTAVIYKVTPWLSAYASYQQSLTPGQIVGKTNSSGLLYTNNQAVIAPYIGTQWEAGLKATVGQNMLATLAYFDIDQQNIFDQINGDGTATLKVGGAEEHKGVEVTITGKATENLALFGGFTVMDPRIKDKPTSPYQNGYLAPNVSPVTGKLYAEYTLPMIDEAPWLHGLTLTGGYSYRGPFNTNLPSNYGATVSKLPGYAIGDLGFRYETRIDEHIVTARFTVTNFTNHAYMPSFAYLGPGRVFLASAEVKW